MKSQRLRPLLAATLSACHSLTLKKKLLRLTPTQSLLQGFYFEGSSYSPDLFYVSVFTMPLYVLSEGLHFTFGDRLRNSRGTDGWDATDNDVASNLDSAIRLRGLPYLASQSTPRTLADKLAARGGFENVHIPAAIAYSYAAAGDFRRAKRFLGRLRSSLSREDPISRPWVAEVAAQADQFAAALSSGTTETLLADWERKTREALRAYL